MPDEKLFTVQEVAQHYRVSEVTVVKAIKAGRLRALKVEKQYRIPASALDEWTTGAPPGKAEP